MPWPFSKDDETHNKKSSLQSLVDAFRRPEVLGATAVLTAGTLTVASIYRSRLRRLPTAAHIGPDNLRGRTIYGRVTSVGDGDNFRLYHTPGGRLAGWGWLPGRRVPTKREDLKDQTIHLRLAGIDAPELPHFGKPGQPYGKEALDWLTDYVLHRNVRAQLWRRDQYERVVGTAYVRRGIFGFLFRKDVSLEMLKGGLVTVYEAKFGSEFGNREQAYRAAEEKAKSRGQGMWTEKSVWQRLTGTGKETPTESPREFKTRMKGKDKEKP